MHLIELYFSFYALEIFQWIYIQRMKDSYIFFYNFIWYAEDKCFKSFEKKSRGKNQDKFCLFESVFPCP